MSNNTEDYDTNTEYEVSFDHAWPPSEEEVDRWLEEEQKFLALNENDGSILG